MSAMKPEEFLGFVQEGKPWHPKDAILLGGSAPYVPYDLSQLARRPHKRPWAMRQAGDRQENLRARWAAMTQALGVAAHWPLYEEVIRRYCEPWRYYHTTQHLEECFALVPDAYASHGVLSVAIFFHDVVYDPREKYNEHKSSEFLLSHLPCPHIQEVPRYISATILHETRKDEEALALFLDIDLSILGADSPRYLAYCHNIRQEYAWVREEQYRRARGSVLSAFLSRPSLYLTPPFQQRFEQRARLNIQRELQSLSNPPDD